MRAFHVSQSGIQCRFDLGVTAPTATIVGGVSIAQIHYFLAVAESGHVGRASAALRIAQPAVSRQIRGLEEELGAALFIRTPRGMRLSKAGAVFAQHARGIVTSIDIASTAVRDAVRAGGSGGAAR